MSESVLLIAPVALPLLMASITILLRRRPLWSEGVAFATVLVTLAASFVLLERSLAATILPVSVFGGWPSGIGVSFAARLPGTALVTVSMIIALAVALYGRAAIGARRRMAGYDALMLGMIAAVNGCFLTNDLFNLYVWFEMALLCALGLILLDRREAQLGAAFRYAAVSIVAATAILTGIGLLYGMVGSLDLGILAGRLMHNPPTLATAAAAALFLAGFGLKAGLVPMHAWLPASYATAPVSVAAGFGGWLTKMGFYALLLVLGGVFGLGTGAIGAGPVAPLLPWIAAGTMLFCALAALGQNDMRRLIGYHVIAQVGYMVAALSIGTRMGMEAASFYMMHSMIVQTNLYLGIGAIYRATGSWKLSHTGGMMRSNPVFCALFAVPMLSLAGIPPLSGFWAKILVFRSAVNAGEYVVVIAGLIAALLTIFSVAIFWSATCWKDLRNRNPRKVPLPMLLGMGVLSLTTLFIGLNPRPVHYIAEQSAAAVARMGVFG